MSGGEYSALCFDLLFNGAIWWTYMYVAVLHTRNRKQEVGYNLLSFSCASHVSTSGAIPFNPGLLSLRKQWL